VLLRALAINDPEYGRARRLAAEALIAQPAWFEPLGSYAALQALSQRQALDPMGVVEDVGQRALLAEALLAETKPPGESEVQSAIQEIHERAIEHRLRELRSEMEAAQHRGDRAREDALALQQVELRIALRQLHTQPPPEL
jgi:DNA primase